MGILMRLMAYTHGTWQKNPDAHEIQDNIWLIKNGVSIHNIIFADPILCHARQWVMWAALMSIFPIFDNVTNNLIIFVLIFRIELFFHSHLWMP